MKSFIRMKPEFLLKPMDITWAQTIFNPTIDMAAELMNVPVATIEEWLTQAHMAPAFCDRLTDAAIDFLAHKYVARLHQYYDNCVSSWDDLAFKDHLLFSRFKGKYRKNYLAWVSEWADIDTQRIVMDFKEELQKMARESNSFEPFELSSIVVKDVDWEIEAYPIYFRGEEEPDKGVLLFAISHSLYYGSRIKTKVPNKPGHRNLLLEFLQENRFHIFTGESDDNGPIDAFLSFQVKNQPQLAIVHVFGYQRHKNDSGNETIYKTPAYCRHIS